MNELALFAGAGGGILGGALLGWRTVCAVELDEYARNVLLARQNDGCLAPFPVWDDIRTFDGRTWRGVVDVVSGGFPCQDISCAGKGAGITGRRSGLWSEMARIIGEVRPRFVWVENSPLLVSRGLAVVLGDLASLGFGGELWELITPALRTSGTECGYWPTPRASEAAHSGRTSVNHSGQVGLAEAVNNTPKFWPTPTVCGNYNRKGLSATSGDGLATAVQGKSRMWPTPTATQCKGSSPAALTRKDGQSRENDRPDHAVMASDGGKLNPDWVEWLMGWPIGWTACEPLETDKFRQWCDSHGMC